MGATEYLSSASRLNSVFVSSGFNQYHKMEEAQPIVTREKLYTVYNGICDVHTVQDKVLPQQKLHFR